jgi:hypothetical protein
VGEHTVLFAPAKTALVYQHVNEYWPEFKIELASKDKHLLAYITQEFEDCLRCGRFEHGRFRIFTNDGFGSKAAIENSVGSIAASCRKAAIQWPLISLL